MWHTLHSEFAFSTLRARYACTVYTIIGHITHTIITLVGQLLWLLLLINWKG